MGSFEIFFFLHMLVMVCQELSASVLFIFKIICVSQNKSS